MNMPDYFDKLYRSHSRYWWRGDNRYSTDPSSHPLSLLTQLTLRALEGRPPGRALDLGAGEGADSIRLARLGYSVDAVEISKVGASKISRFADAANETVNVVVADISSYEPNEKFDVVICNGVLHYVDDKKPVVERMQAVTKAGGINVISLWSNYTPVPKCHQIVPAWCDDEDGLVVKLYQEWAKTFVYFDRAKPETAHAGMPPHSHSYIKIVARKPA
jgi:tellurite methyltransferase